MDPHRFSFIPLLLVVLLAFVVPLLLSRFRRMGIPIVVGEILAGMVLGQSGLNLIGENQVLEILSILGFSLLMFLSGLEIDFSGIQSTSNRGKIGFLAGVLQNPFSLGTLLFLLTMGGALGAAWVGQRMELLSDPWMMALVLSTTSLGVVVPVLKEGGHTGSVYGQTILTAALVADFTSILAISVYVLLRSQGLTVEILLLLVFFVVFVVVHRLITLFQRHLPTERILEGLATPTSQIKMRGAIALALIFIALAESLGIENILGAFLAGVILSLASSSSTSTLREKLDGIGYGFFIPIFFIMVGVQFDLPALLASRTAVLMVPAMLLTAYSIKLLPALLLRRQFSWRESIAAGFLLSSRLSLIIAAAAIGLQMGVISPAMNSSIILVAIISCTLSPVIFNQMMGTAFTRPSERILILGTRPMADLLLRRFQSHGIPSLRIGLQDILPGNEAENGTPIAQQVLVEGLRKVEITRFSKLITMDEGDEINYRINRLAAQVFGMENMITLVHDPAQNGRFRELGTHVVNMAYSTALIIESLALSEEAFSVSADLDEFQDVREVKVLNPTMNGKSITDLDLPASVHVLMLVRGGNLISPDEGTRLQSNDLVTLVGEGEDLDRVERSFFRG